MVQILSKHNIDTSISRTKTICLHAVNCCFYFSWVLLLLRCCNPISVGWTILKHCAIKEFNNKEVMQVVVYVVRIWCEVTARNFDLQRDW
jgi:hypothetical protein